MSKASATSCTWTPDTSLSFTAFTLNSAVYREIFLGPFVLAIHTSSVRPECQLYRVNCRVRCSDLLGVNFSRSRPEPCLARLSRLPGRFPPLSARTFPRLRRPCRRLPCARQPTLGTDHPPPSRRASEACHRNAPNRSVWSGLIHGDGGIPERRTRGSRIQRLVSRPKPSVAP